MISTNLKQHIENVRHLINEKYQQQNDQFAQIDIERINTDDWQVERFLEEYNFNETKATDALLKTLQWRNESGINTINDRDFFAELWEISQFEIHGKDHQGRIILWTTVQNVAIPKDLMEMTKRFALYIYERADRIAGRNGFVMIINTKHAGLNNIQLDLIRFSVDFPKYFPGGCKTWFIVDQPFFVRTLVNLVLSLMDEKMRKGVVLLDSSQLSKYIDNALIPISMNGHRIKVKSYDSLPLKECYQTLGFTDKNCIDFNKLISTIKKP